jgi:uncharacterized membrane protein YdjX (TVP38/TMEM64 family)
MYNHFKYPNLTLFFLILIITIIFFRGGMLAEWISYFGEWKYIGAFFAGMFFVLTFSVAPALAALIIMADQMNAVMISLVAGIGATLGDYTILKFFEDRLFEELKEIFSKISGRNILKFHHIIHTKYFAWLGPVIGALIIASPFPDELGIAILGIYRLNPKKFALLSFLLNTGGIFLVVSAGKAIL